MIKQIVNSNDYDRDVIRILRACNEITTMKIKGIYSKISDEIIEELSKYAKKSKPVQVEHLTFDLHTKQQFLVLELFSELKVLTTILWQNDLDEQHEVFLPKFIELLNSYDQLDLRLSADLLQIANQIKEGLITELNPFFESYQYDDTLQLTHNYSSVKSLIIEFPREAFFELVCNNSGLFARAEIELTADFDVNANCLLKFIAARGEQIIFLPYGDTYTAEILASLAHNCPNLCGASLHISNEEPDADVLSTLNATLSRNANRKCMPNGASFASDVKRYCRNGEKMILQFADKTACEQYDKLLKQLNCAHICVNYQEPITSIEDSVFY